MNTFNRPSFPRGNRPPRPFNRQGGGTPDTHRINDFIRAKEVLLIGENGEQFGILPTRQAQTKAEEAGLDLVEVSPNAKPPVCRVMDYGKFKYREQKRESQARKNRSEVELKELRLRYRTDSGDLDTKLKHAREFLEEGDKVKFSMRFRGREAMYIDLGVAKFNEVIQKLSDIAIVEERSPAFGKQIHIILAPGAKK